MDKEQARSYRERKAMAVRADREANGEPSPEEKLRRLALIVDFARSQQWLERSPRQEAEIEAVRNRWVLLKRKFLEDRGIGDE